MTDNNNMSLDWVRDKVRELNGIEQEAVLALQDVDGSGSGTNLHLHKLSLSECNVFISKIQYFVRERSKLEQQLQTVSRLLDANKSTILLNDDLNSPYLLCDALDHLFESPLDIYIDYFEDLKNEIIKYGDKKQFIDDDKKLGALKTNLRNANYIKSLWYYMAMIFRRIFLEFSWRQRKKIHVDEPGEDVYK